MRYAALLRGINAGGKRRVPMAELRQLFEGMRYSDVSTYINSGNVIFSSEKTPDAANIQTALRAHFGFAIDVLVLPAADILRIAEAVPAEWKNDYSEHKSDGCYLFADVDTPDIVEQLRVQPNIEIVEYVPGALLSYVSRNNQRHSSLYRLIGTPLYQRRTVRNTTTARKLADIAKQ